MISSTRTVTRKGVSPGRWPVAAFSLPNCGPCVVEDFVPFSEAAALVSCGPSFRELHYICEVDYLVLKGAVVFTNPEIVAGGDYLRLGHRYGDRLIYSDGWRGPHQPFRHETGLYYSDGAPSARLYRDGKTLIDHWEGVPELGNPWVDEYIWFEARDNGPAPHGWSLYRADLDGSNIVRLFEGANPCIYDGILYYGLWNGRSFDIAAADRRNLVPSHPQVRPENACA